MRIGFGVALLLIASSVGLTGMQLPGPGPFGPLRRGPSGQRIGEMHFAPGGSDMNYSLYGDHCELHGDKLLCLFLFTAHTGTAKEWSSQKAWMENYATDQFGEKHYKSGAFFLSGRGNQQPTATLAGGDRIYFVQEFENGERAITQLNIISPLGVIRGLPVL
jgi:hypothetical protein